MQSRSKLEPGRVLMVTHTPEGAAYGLDNGKPVTGSQARDVQSDLFVTANDDGLFPGMSQTWKRDA